MTSFFKKCLFQLQYTNICDETKECRHHLIGDFVILDTNHHIKYMKCDKIKLKSGMLYFIEILNMVVKCKRKTIIEQIYYFNMKKSNF